MYVTRISRYIYLSVISAILHNRGRSRNVLPVDTGALLYSYFQVLARLVCYAGLIDIV
jgi:hypothetical protein